MPAGEERQSHNTYTEDVQDHSSMSPVLVGEDVIGEFMESCKKWGEGKESSDVYSAPHTHPVRCSVTQREAAQPSPAATCQRLCLISLWLSLSCLQAPPSPNVYCATFSCGQHHTVTHRCPRGDKQPCRARHGSFLEGSSQCCPEQVPYLLEGVATLFPLPNNQQNHREKHTTHFTAFAANALSQVTERQIPSIC